MKKLFAIGAFLLASTAAQAQYTFDYGGRTIRIDPDRGTVSIPGVYDNTGRHTKRARSEQDSDRRHKSSPDQAKTEPPAPASTDQNAPAINPPADPAAATASVAPVDTPMASTMPSSADVAPQAPQDAAPAAQPAPAPAIVAAAPSAAPMPKQPAPASASGPSAAAVASASTPLGLWLTEEKEGKVRIEQCGANLCGYSVDAKSNQNGEQVLINMRPAPDSKWSGRILDPNTGSTYDSTIALKGSDTLRVQGCAFGGMFCGGQTWSRLN